MKKFLKVIICLILVAVIACAVIYPYVIKKYGDINIQTGKNLATGSITSYAAEQKRRNEKDVRIMSVNLLADYEGFGGSYVSPRASQFLAMREAFTPDIVALQEMSFNWYCCLQNNKGSYKAVRPLSTFVTMKMTALIYNNEKVRLIKSGDVEFENSDDIRTRRAVWGLFSQRCNGKTFVVISTHLSFVGENGSTPETVEAQAQTLLALAKSLNKENNCPVIIAGDFNSKEYADGNGTALFGASEVYEKLASGFKDARFNAKAHFYGTEKTEKNRLNDHIFINGEIDCPLFSLLSFKCLESMSDHYPLFADVRL